MHAHINIFFEVQQHIGSENRSKLLIAYDIIQTFKWTSVESRNNRKIVSAQYVNMY